MPPVLGFPGMLAQHTAAPLNPSPPKAKPTDTSATQTWDSRPVPGAGAWEDVCHELAQGARLCPDSSPPHEKGSLR